MFIRVEQDADKDDGLAVTKCKADGSIIGLVRLPKSSALTARIKLLKPLGVKPDIVARINADEIPQDIPLFQAPTATAVYSVRHITDKAFKRQTFEDFNSALEFTEKKSKQDLVVEWNNTEEVCCLDIDFKEGELPQNLAVFVDDMRRQAAIVMGSKSGSFHLLYGAHEGFTAIEYAVFAAYELLRVYPQAKCEFISRTRSAVGKARYQDQCIDMKSVRNLMLDWIEKEVDFNEWLAERGMRQGGRYPHDRCPVNPDNSSAGNPPVVVHPHGIKCFKCQSDGKRYGARDAGWFPQSALVGSRMRPNAVLTMADNVVHYDHVEHEVEKFNFRSPDANKALYSGLLKSIHGLDDPRIRMAWHPTGAKKLYRKAGYWVDENNDDVPVVGDASLLMQLPFVYDVGADGSLILNKAKLAWAKTTTDLAPLGYQPFRTVTGYQFTRFDEAQTRILVTYPAYLREYPQARPEYIPQAKRLPWEQCVEIINNIVPGVDMNILEGHTIGIGCAEYQSGVPLMTVTIGPTGSGKSLHMVIAAALVGQLPLKATEQKESQRFFEAVAENAKFSGIFIYDEAFKGFISGDNRLITDLLHLTPESAYHKNYVGSVSIGCRPYLGASDTGIPVEVSRNAQIARRFGVMRLHVEWDISEHLAGKGIADVSRLRQYLNKDELFAVNSWLSHITDDRFSGGAPDFYVELKRLGFGRLREEDSFNDHRALICEFVDSYFKHVNTERDLTNRFAKGSKLARQSQTEKLWATFQLLQTENDRRQGDTECNALAECDLAQVCKRKEVKPGAKFIIKKHGRIVSFYLKDKAKR